MFMFGIGIPELVLILIVGLIVFGPGKLPEVGRAVGKGIREFRKASNALQAVLNEPDPPPKATQNPPQAAPQQPAQTNQTQAQTQEAIEPKQANATAQAAHTIATDVPYTPPTQESVRQELEAKKEAQV